MSAEEKNASTDVRIKKLSALPTKDEINQLAYDLDKLTIKWSARVVERIQKLTGISDERKQKITIMKVNGVFNGSITEPFYIRIIFREASLFKEELVKELQNAALL